MTSKWTACRVFVSSTFEDMAPERELMVKQVFPSLRAHGETAGVLVSGIDLRWGLQTETPGARARVLLRCLLAVDACRPFLIGFVGARRGWVPTRPEIDPETFARFPQLARWVDAGLSLTELEILHGVCPLDRRPPDTGTAAILYVRNDRAGTLSAPLSAALAAHGIAPEADASAGLGAPLIVRSYGEPGSGPHGEMRGTRALAERVAGDLRQLLAVRFPQASSADGPGTYDDRVRASLVEPAVPLRSITARLDRHADEGGGVLAVAGRRGVGKSTCLASWVTQRLRDGHPQPRYRFIGASLLPPNLDGLLESLCDELEQGMPRQPDQADPRHLLSRWRRAWQFAERGTPLVLDGLDRIPFNPDTLQWLSAPLDAGGSVIVSLDPDSPTGLMLLASLAGVPGVSVLPIAGFDTPAERRALVGHRLALSLKELDERSLDRLLAHPLGGHPLYVAIVLSELVLHGRHDDVTERLEQRLHGDLQAAVKSLLRRLETDVPALGGLSADGVRLVLGALANSPSGLSTSDLLRLLGDGSAGDVESLLHQLAPFLQRRPFAHAYSSALFAEIVREHVPQPPPREPGDRAPAWPLLLGRLLHELPVAVDGSPHEARAAAVRRACDLPRHLAARGEFDALASHLTRPAEVVSRIALTGISSLLADLADCIADQRCGGLPPPLAQRVAATRDLIARSASTLPSPSTALPDPAPIARQLHLQAGLLGFDGLAADYGALVTDAPLASVRWCRHSGDRHDELHVPPIWARLVMSADARWMLVHDGGLHGAEQDEGRCWLWDLEERREALVFDWPGDRVICAAFGCADDPARWLVLGTAHGRLLRIHVASGRMLSSIDTGGETVTMLSPDGDGLWCCVSERELLRCTWDAGVVYRLSCPGITAVHARPGRPGAAIAAGRHGEVWSVDAGIARPRRWGMALGGPATRIVADPAGGRAWVLVDGRGIAELDLQRCTIEHPFEEYRPLFDLALHAGAGALVAANGVGELSLFDLRTRARRTVKCVQNAAVSVVVGPAGHAWVAGQPEPAHAPVVRVDLDEPVGTAPELADRNEGTITAVSLSADGLLAAHTFLHGRVWVHDASDGAHQFDLEPRQLDRVSCCAFSRDARVFVVGSLWSLLLIDAQRHQVIAQYGAEGAWGTAKFDGVRAIAFGPRDDVLYAGDSQGLLVAIAARSGEAIGYARLDSPPTGIATLDDGGVVVSEESGALSIFGIALAPLQRWTAAPHGACWAMAASSSAVYTGHRRGLIVRRTPCVENSGVPFAEHDGDVEALVLFDGGRALASAGRDGHLRCWRTRDAAQFLDVRFADALENLAVSADGSTMLLSLSRGTLVCLAVRGLPVHANA